MVVDSPKLTSRNLDFAVKLPAADRLFKVSLTAEKTSFDMRREDQMQTSGNYTPAFSPKMLAEDSARRREILSWNQGPTSEDTTVVTLNTVALLQDTSRKSREADGVDLKQTIIKCEGSSEVSKPATVVIDDESGSISKRRTRNAKVVSLTHDKAKEPEPRASLPRNSLGVLNHPDGNTVVTWAQ